jgi:hypothetical protein
MLASHRDHSTS